MTDIGVDDVKTEQPGSVAEASALLRDTSGPVLFRGAGTKLGWAGRPDPPDLVVATTALRDVLAYNPADMTVVVQAGMPLRDLQAVAGEKGQWVALDPATQQDGATVGGLLATADSGPRRLRFGGMRDLVIGVTVVLSDGTVAHSGGTVIKNVAGYDLAKLLHGSLGTLGLVTEVALRLHPMPQASATAVVETGIEGATALATALMASPLEPVAVDWGTVDDDDQHDDAAGGGAGGLLAVRFEGSPAGVQGRREAVLDLLSSGGTAGGARWLTGADQDDVWARLERGHRRPGSGATSTTAGVGGLPTRTTDIARALTGSGQQHGIATRLAARPALGLHTATFDGPAEGVSAAFTAWRERVLALGGSVVLRDRPVEVDALVDPMGPPPSSAGLLRALSARLDPGGRCAPGRLGSWLVPLTA